ncbi:H-NS family nucleoid-associated regulatory protein [Burkholderia ubonensis]|uniref:H-NS histone family protein n=1 Tax=Burkholderia ubonensis TaxID=101571 RepID=UPI0012FC4FD6|nr:H-NS histone family protein [Burkholderia ubonensis]
MKEYRDLIAMREKLDEEIESARANARHAAFLEIKQLIVEFRISAKEMREFMRRGGGRRTPVPKYWNPRTGETWSGRGRRPKWLNEQDMETFRLPVSDEPPVSQEEQGAQDAGGQGYAERPDKPGWMSGRPEPDEGE